MGVHGRVREVGHVAAQLARVERRDQRLLVNQLVAGEVQQHRAWPHQPDLAGVEQLPGRVGQRHVQGYEVALGEQPLQAVDPVDLRGQL